MDDKLKDLIRKYKGSHPREITINWNGETDTYQVEQLGLDIIEELERIISDKDDKIANLMDFAT